MQCAGFLGTCSVGQPDSDHSQLRPTHGLSFTRQTCRLPGSSTWEGPSPVSRAPTLGGLLRSMPPWNPLQSGTMARRHACGLPGGSATSDGNKSPPQLRQSLDPNRTAMAEQTCGDERQRHDRACSNLASTRPLTNWQPSAARSANDDQLSRNSFRWHLSEQSSQGEHAPR